MRLVGVINKQNNSKEIKNHEYRVGLTPASVAELVAHGHDLFVETKGRSRNGGLWGGSSASPLPLRRGRARRG